MAGKMTTTPPKYEPPPRRTYTDLGWICAALTGPATFLAVWIYCAVTYGFFVGLWLGLDSCPHPRIAGRRGDDLSVASGSGSASICDLQSFCYSSGIADLHRLVRWHHRTRSGLVVACRSGQVVALKGRSSPTIRNAATKKVGARAGQWPPLRPGAASRSSAATPCLAAVALIPTQSGIQRIALS
jgi:hypothetical protein